MKTMTLTESTQLDLDDPSRNLTGPTNFCYIDYNSTMESSKELTDQFVN